MQVGARFTYQRPVLWFLRQDFPLTWNLPSCLGWLAVKPPGVHPSPPLQYWSYRDVLPCLAHILGLFYMCECLVCVTVHHVCTVPLKVDEGVWVPWNRSWKQPRAIVWVLGIKPGSFERAKSTLNHWASLHTHTYTYLFNVGSEILTQVFLLARQALYWLCYLPSPEEHFLKCELSGGTKNFC